ncbi:MAG: glutathione S-transferase N-terminal domain-containing protein [Aquisalimonadaceae bacterium]
MQLYLNATSPYARVARVAALEKGLEERVTLCWVDPWGDDEALIGANPVGRVPALRTDDDDCVSESLLIAQVFDKLGTGAPLLPANRLTAVLSLAGLGQGLTDAAFGLVIGRKLGSAAEKDGILMARRHHAIERTLTVLGGDRISGALSAAAPTLGDIVVGVALAYLEFRLPEYQWRRQSDILVGFYDELAARKSFAATAFS